MQSFQNANGRQILLEMVRAIQENKGYLGEIDGLIGDGDHGANMSKGFSLYEQQLASGETPFTDGLDDLGMVLFNKIGGSMGPIYGSVLTGMAQYGANAEKIDLTLFTGMLDAGLQELYEIVDARPGDKTLIDTLAPSIEALANAQILGKSFDEALLDMKQAAQNGSDSTKQMVAKYGRSSRLGERSRGVLDAGAASCCIILCAMADGILQVLS